MKSREQVEIDRQLANVINPYLSSDEEVQLRALLEAEREARLEADRRYDASIRRRLAVNQKKRSCRSRCHGAPCEFVEGHKGMHITTKDGGFGFWHTDHQEPPNAWDKIIDGFGL